MIRFLCYRRKTNLRYGENQSLLLRDPKASEYFAPRPRAVFPEAQARRWVSDQRFFVSRQGPAPPSQKQKPARSPAVQHKQTGIFLIAFQKVRAARKKIIWRICSSDWRNLEYSKS